jgi:hypothetical protein
MESEIRARIMAAKAGIGSVAPWVGANTCAERAKKDCFKLCSVLILLVSSLFDCFRMSGHKLHQAVRCDCGWVDWFASWLCCELFKLLISSYLGEPLWTSPAIGLWFEAWLAVWSLQVVCASNQDPLLEPVSKPHPESRICCQSQGLYQTQTRSGPITISINPNSLSNNKIK